MSSDPSPSYPPPLSPGLGVLGALGYFVISVVWMIVIGIASVAGAFAMGVEFPTDGTPPDLPVSLLGATTWVQFAGMFAIAAGLAALLRRSQRVAFAISVPRWPALLAGVLGGLTVGIFPGKLVEAILEYWPWLNLGGLQLINDKIAEGPLFGRVLFVSAVCIGAPVVEELVFRGFLFDAFKPALRPAGAWIATSMLFAMYHLDPVHVIGVFFTGLFLGWLRLVSKSIYPSIIAHFVNNSLAALMAIAFGEQLESGDTAPWWFAIGALVVTLAFAGVAWAGRIEEEPAQA